MSAKRPFGGPRQVYQYLGRYIYRVAISNGRLVTMDDHAVVFRTRGDQTASLPPTEFIGRFLQHILPKGFVKIRHFGLMSSGNVTLVVFCPPLPLMLPTMPAMTTMGTQAPCRPPR